MTITDTAQLVVPGRSTRRVLVQNTGDETVLLTNTADAEGGIRVVPGAAFEQPHPCSVAGPLYARTEAGTTSTVALLTVG